MAPGGADPDWWVAPRLATEKPVVAEEGPDGSTCNCRLYAKAGTTDALTAMDRWFAIYGAPKPEPPARTARPGRTRSASAPAATSTVSGTPRPEVVRLPQRAQHRHQPRPAPAYLYDTVYASRLASDAAIRARCAERVAEVAQLGGPQPAADDLGFEFGNPVNGAARAEADRVAGMIHAQGDGRLLALPCPYREDRRLRRDGLLRTRPGQRRRGRHLRPERLYRSSTIARITGDPKATAAGLKALEFMEQFTVPRAAQVWEVPVHTPDVLASADASEAYLEGYLITGKHGVPGARRLLGAHRPAVLLHVGYPRLPHAALRLDPRLRRKLVHLQLVRPAGPVERPAPRPRLRAPGALRQVLPWRTDRRGADGELHVAAARQADRRRPLARHQRPVDRRCGPTTSTASISSAARGSSPRGRSSTWSTASWACRPSRRWPSPDAAPQQARIIACANIDGAHWQGDKLTARLLFAPPQTSQIVVISVSKPTSVTINGTALPETPKLSSAAGPGWEYLPTPRLLHIKPGPGPQVRLEIGGAKYEQGSMSVGVVDKLDFAFDQDAEGWRAARDLTEPTFQAGVLTMGITGTDPYFIRTNLNLAPDTVKSFVARLSVSAGTEGVLQVFWTTEDSPDFEEAKSLKVPLIADGEFHDYQVPVGESPRWQGRRVTGLRLDFGNGPAGAVVRLDSIRGMD